MSNRPLKSVELCNFTLSNSVRRIPGVLIPTISISNMHPFISLPLFIGNLRGWEWLIILLAILLLFGGKKIPELMKGIGKGVHSFRQGMEEAKKEINKIDDDGGKPSSDSKK